MNTQVLIVTYWLMNLTYLQGKRERGRKSTLETKWMNFEEKTKRRFTHLFIPHVYTNLYIKIQWKKKSVLMIIKSSLSQYRKTPEGHFSCGDKLWLLPVLRLCFQWRINEAKKSGPPDVTACSYAPPPPSASSSDNWNVFNYIHKYRIVLQLTDIDWICII